MSLAESYAQEIHEECGLYVNWLPEVPLALGDFGTLEDGVFIRSGSLNCKIIKRENSKGTPFVYRSAGVVEIRMSGDAQANIGNGSDPIVKGSMKIEFKKEKTICVRLEGHRIETIENLRDVERAIIAKVEADQWGNFFVVTTLHTAERGTILISQSANAHVDFGVAGTGDLADLGNAELRLSMKSQEGLGLEIVNAPDLTPFCGLMRLKGWLDKRLEPKRLAAGSTGNEEVGQPRLVPLP